MSLQKIISDVYLVICDHSNLFAVCRMKIMGSLMTMILQLEIGTNSFEPKLETELITAVAWHCRENLELAYFLSSFGRLRHRIAIKCVPHVELDDFFSLSHRSCYCLFV